jgi:hypothetical protein
MLPEGFRNLDLATKDGRRYPSKLINDNNKKAIKAFHPSPVAHKSFHPIISWKIQISPFLQSAVQGPDPFYSLSF